MAFCNASLRVGNDCEAGVEGGILPAVGTEVQLVARRTFHEEAVIWIHSVVPLRHQIGHIEVKREDSPSPVSPFDPIALRLSVLLA